MANIELKQFTYTDDFGKEYENYKLKFERGQLEKADVGFYQDRGDGKAVTCGTASYFKPRRIKAVFTDGKSIELPIPTLGDVKSTAEQLLANTDIACLSLLGEQWRVIPAGILGGEYANDGLAGADKPSTEKIRYEYKLDGGSQIIRAISIEEAPSELADAQKSCITQVSGGVSIVCTVGGGIEPRHFKGYRVNTSTDGKFGRKIIVSDNSESDIKSCGANVMNAFNCLGYQGETIANLADFYSGQAI